VDGVRIASASSRDGQVYASVRPEDILISLAPIESSARNTFSGKIQDIADIGTIMKVTVDAGIEIVAAITRRSFLDMNLREGIDVFLTFKAVDVHVF